MKKILALILSLFSALALLAGCGGGGGTTNSSSSSAPEVDNTIEATISPVVYSDEVIKKVEETTSGNFEDWLDERSVYGMASNSVIEVHSIA